MLQVTGLSIFQPLRANIWRREDLSPSHMNGPNSNVSLLRPIQTTHPPGFSANARLRILCPQPAFSVAHDARFQAHMPPAYRAGARSEERRVGSSGGCKLLVSFQSSR